MKQFRRLDEIDGIEDTVIAVGNFDGVHKGHQELIRRAVESAKTAGMKSAVFTFANHPKNVMNGRTTIKNIQRFEDKVRAIESLGVEYLFIIDFTKKIADMTPVCFVEKVLCDLLGMKEVCCGFNYAFGKNGTGTPELLAQMSMKKGFGLHILEPVKVNGRLVSSTLIRKYIRAGDMENCLTYMGRLYEIGGHVVVGNKIGRTIGFPTSNIELDESMVTPSHGVYATLCKYNGAEFKSVTNVGLRPTIGDHKKTIETHIFDFSKEIYGKEIQVAFLKKLRDEMKFESVEILSAQIRRDCEHAKKFHENL